MHEHNLDTPLSIIQMTPRK
uniref:Uncharacterized protein n=1 Tax=Arundo donax TaxID=35708 RepID=A0A0A9GN96_ARUDO